MGFFDIDNEQHRNLADAFNKGDYSNFPPEAISDAYSGFVNAGPKEHVEQIHQEYFQQMPQVQKMGLFSGLMDAVKGQGIDPRQAGINTTDPAKASPTDLGNLFSFAQNSGLLNGILGSGGGQPASGGLFGGSSQAPQAAQGGMGGLGGLSGMLGGLMGGGQSQQPAYNQPNQGGQQSAMGGGLQGLLSNPMAQAALSGLAAYAANRAISGFANRGQSQQGAQPKHQPQPNNSSNQGRTMSSNQTGSDLIQEPGGGSALPGFEKPR